MIILFLPTLSWPAFRAACEGGGSPPEWTQRGDDPTRWHNADDAAGRLWLASWGAGEGDYPPETDSDGWVATYRSSTGAIVALGYLYRDGGPVLAIYRPGQAPRLGVRGEAARSAIVHPMYRVDANNPEHDIYAGESFSAYVLRMVADVAGDCHLEVDAVEYPDLVDFLGTVPSDALAAAFFAEVAMEQVREFMGHPEVMLPLEGATDEVYSVVPLDDDGDPIDEDDYARQVFLVGFSDAFTRAELLGWVDGRIDGFLIRVANRLRSA